MLQKKRICHQRWVDILLAAKCINNTQLLSHRNHIMAFFVLLELNGFVWLWFADFWYNRLILREASWNGYYDVISSSSIVTQTHKHMVTQQHNAKEHPIHIHKCWAINSSHNCECVDKLKFMHNDLCMYQGMETWICMR